MARRRRPHRIVRWHQASSRAYARFTRQWANTLRVLSVCFDVLTVVSSLICLVAIAIYGGFDSSVVSFDDVRPLLRGCQATFIFNILFNLILRFRITLAETRPLRWFIDVLMLLTLIPWLWPHPVNPWWPALDSLLYSRFTLVAVLGLYASVYLCFALVRSLGKHTNPSLILSISFLLFIAVGSALLMLPRCTVSGISLPDSIFVSTSAVCICGLTTVDISTTFTPLGLCILAMMMQVGALGVMTFTSFFALFFSGRPSIYSQLMVKDMIYSKTVNSLLPTLAYTLVFTLAVEAIGAVAIYWSVVDTIPGYSQADYITFAAFHSLSAFCNAGFSTIGNGLSNPALLQGNQLIYLVVSALVIAGGIGFPILVNAKDAIAFRLRELWHIVRRRPHTRPPHLYNLNSRVVLISSTILFIGGAIIFFILERNNSLAGMSPYEKTVQSIFNAVTPRSAGFSSVNPAGFLPVTLLVIMFFMWIGGGSQSTAGGIKVNTFAAALLHLRASVLGRRRVEVFNRTISTASLSRAHSVIALSIISYLLLSFVLLAIEPELPPRMLLFESLSALFTVGSSLGATPLLSTAGKLIICGAMFVGRVGLLSLLAGLAGERHKPAPELPEDNLIIN